MGIFSSIGALALSVGLAYLWWKGLGRLVQWAKNSGFPKLVEWLVLLAYAFLLPAVAIQLLPENLKRYFFDF